MIDYFTKILEDNLKAVVKPQYVDQIPRAVKGPVQQVQELIMARAALGNEDEIMDVLGVFLHRIIFRYSR
jgi:ATP-binding cassette subfamily E protein 1